MALARSPRRSADSQLSADTAPEKSGSNGAPPRGFDSVVMVGRPLQQPFRTRGARKC